MPRAHDILHELKARPPHLHGDASWRRSVNWGLEHRVLEWLASVVGPGARTLETGCGHSTIVFAAIGTRHTAISPLPEEHERVLAWCREHGVATDTLELIAGPSHEILPRLEPGPLDLVLIDGQHAFPWPMLDWFYTAEHVRAGGLVVLDDTQLRAVALLRDFLLREVGRWSLICEPGRAAVFRKLPARVHQGIWWGNQPWGARTLPRPVSWLRRLVAGLHAPARRLAGPGGGVFRSFLK